MTVLDTRADFDTDGVYLDTASMGLPPRVAFEAMQQDLEQCRRGKVRPQDYDHFVETSRELYARFVGVDASWVAAGPQVSVFTGVVAASLPPGSVVLVATNEFTSVTFPFLAAGHDVREAPLADLAEAVDDSVDLVAVAAVQSSSGAPADLAALAAACTSYDARLLVDLTQAAGWLPVDASRFDYTVCSAYKWLLSPRGTCFFTVRPELRDSLVPVAAGWYAGQDPWDSIYGTPLRLADDARRFDVSPAWHSWVGTAESLSYLTSIGSETLHAHALDLADRFRDDVGLPLGGPPIVSLDVQGDVAHSLRRHDVLASVRAGRLRLSFHVNNSAADVGVVAAALEPHLSY